MTGIKKFIDGALEAAKELAEDSECGVHGCERTESLEIVWLKPLDPIDHTKTPITLCHRHQQWAEERNAFAEDVADKLREKRTEIGKEHIETVQRLAHPQDGELSEDFLMGDASKAPDYLEGKVVEE